MCGILSLSVEIRDILQPHKTVTESFSEILRPISADSLLFTLVDQQEPYWAADANGNLTRGIEEVCTISADLSGLSGALNQRRGSGGTYWTLGYEIGIQFGGTELEAYLEWTEGGETRRSQAQIIPNSPG